MIRIYAGRSGTGKSYAVYDEIYRLVAKKDIILIVPEQSSFQSEKRILDKLGARSASKVSVLSFSRMCDNLSELYGVRHGRRIDDGDRAVLMSLAIEQCSDRLQLFGAKGNKNDLVELMLGAVNEYKMCAIESGELYSLAQTLHSPRLSQKLKESAIVYDAYCALVENTYIDPDDDLKHLYKLLQQHHYFSGKTVYIDSFSGFSGQELKIIEEIIKYAETLTVTLCCDSISGEKASRSMFFEPKQTMERLRAIALNNGIPTEPVKWFTENRRAKIDSLRAVEESLFRFDGDTYECDEGVYLYFAEDEYDEIKEVCRKILKLVYDEDYSFRDISIICRDQDKYKSIFETEFQKHNIPYFMSSSQPLNSKPLIRLVMSAFDIVHTSFNTEKVFAYLKTGLTGIDPYDVYRLENYAFMWNIRSSSWKKPFTMNPNGNTDKTDDEELKQLESARKAVIEPLVKFQNDLQNSHNGADLSKAVYSLLERINAAENVKSLVSKLSSLGEMNAIGEQSRVWDTCIGILDKMYTILGNTPMDSKKYYSLLQLMVTKSPISDIPQTIDSVTVGIAGNIRSENPRAVFVVGAVEGAFPAVAEAGGIFSDNEREELRNADLQIYDTLYYSALKEKYIAYTSLSSARERLFVSFHKRSISGEACEPSIIVRELVAMFDDLPVNEYSGLKNEELYFTKRQSFEICTGIWNDNTSSSVTLKDYFGNDDEYRSLTAAVERAVDDKPFAISDNNIAKRLFGYSPTLSASQIESYYLCPFAYFCKYGLSVRRPERPDMTPSLYGSAVHFIMEKTLKNEGFSVIREYTSSQLLTLVDRYLKEFIITIGGDGYRSARFEAQCRSMEKNIVALLTRLIDEFLQSDFVPVDFELEISDDGDIPAYDLHLPDGSAVKVVGKVDRVDTYTYGDNKYIRIVDYKTGNKKFSLSDVMYGLNLQMLLYLSAINKNGTSFYCSGNERLIPAGVLYMPSTPESGTAEYHTESLIKEKEQDKQRAFRMDGLIIDDPQVLSAMENNSGGIFIPVKKTSKGTIDSRSRSKLASLESFGSIFRKIDEEILNMADSLLNGDIKRLPAKKSVDACAYCDYKAVCGYDEGKETRRIEKQNDSEILEQLKEEKK